MLTGLPWKGTKIILSFLSLHLLGQCAIPFAATAVWIQVMAPDMSGQCVISLVLSRHSKDLKCWTNVTSQLQLSFILQAKDSTLLRHKGGPTPKERSQSVLASFFYTFVSSPPWACPMQIGLAKKGHICFTWSPWILLCSAFAGFSLSLSFSHCYCGLLFPVLTT